MYRARDSRLGRDVAIKVLPASLSNDADRLRRFEQEARAAGVLNHPNITAVYDVGTHVGSPYIVQELLEGETLRSELASGGLSPRRAIDYALQIAHGLAAAHEKAIVHRDLKPENLFVTRDGRVKILDLGLAKLIHPETSLQEQTSAPTQTPGTEPGVVMGTVGYMSPEQVRGQPADHRSDIFSFGSILYEMLSGRSPFKGESAVETMSAILKEDPADLSETSRSLPAGLERLVRHCLEKRPEQRFQSARDIGFDLETMSSAASVPAATLVPAGTRRRWLRRAALALVPVAALIVGLVLGSRMRSGASPNFQQLTFQRGTMLSARFAPDGQAILYGAAWNGKPFEVFETRAGSTLSRSLGLPPGDVFAVSDSGSVALSLDRHFASAWMTQGTLAQVALAGGSPRALAADINWADWGPGGRELAVVRERGSVLEFPVGKVLYQTSGHVSHVRVRPSGDLVAFCDHPTKAGDTGGIAVVDRNGRKRDLSTGWESVWGLAWSPRGDEVWFTGARTGGRRDLHAVSLSGRERLILTSVGPLTLFDVDGRGRALLGRDSHGAGILVAGRGGARDLSYLDFSAARDLSTDGSLLLFDEPGDGGGAHGAVYIRKTDGSAPVQIGEGYSTALSPDLKWVLSVPPGPFEPEALLLPTGLGQPMRLPPLAAGILWADWMPNGQELLVCAGQPGRTAKLYLQDVKTGKIRPASPDGVTLLPYSHLISPDSRLVAARGPDQKVRLYPLDGSPGRDIPGLEPVEDPLRWSADGRFLYVYRPGELPPKLARLEVSTGRRESWKELPLPDPAGVVFVRPPQLTPDGEICVYTYSRFMTELFLVEGLR